MSAARSTGALVLALWAAACTGNEAPGNDREAALSPPEPAAEVADVGAAIAGVAPAQLVPGTLTDADLGSLPGQGLRCLYRFTRVGLPVLAYGGASAVIKLNDRLVPLPATGEGRYSAGGVTVTVRPLDEEPAGEEAFETELVVRFPDTPDELGYHGYSRCATTGAS